MKKVMVTFGTRPEAIKMAPVVAELHKVKGLSTVIVSTGQHLEILNQVLRSFNIQPNHNLAVMLEQQSLADITANILHKFQEILKVEKPDLVLVHGDTSTAFSAALAAFYAGIPVGHVEAGLRTFNINSPFPEEFNRQAVGIISQLHFAPTSEAMENLVKEGKKRSSITITGNTVVDAMKTTISDDYQHEALDWVGEHRLILLTSHRRENIGLPMQNVFKAVQRIISDFPDVKVLFPMHPNPIVKAIAKEAFGEQERIKLTDPLGVIDFHNFMARSYIIVTDSGGIQEEAPSLGAPVLVTRDTTERPEGLRAGTARLVGSDEAEVYSNLRELLTDVSSYHQMSGVKNPYGDGHASRRIVDRVIEFLIQ